MKKNTANDAFTELAGPLNTIRQLKRPLVSFPYLVVLAALFKNFSHG